MFSSDGKMRIDVCGTNICCYIIQTNTPINELPHHNIVPRLRFMTLSLRSSALPGKSQNGSIVQYQIFHQYYILLYATILINGKTSLFWPWNVSWICIMLFSLTGVLRKSHACAQTCTHTQRCTRTDVHTQRPQ